MRSSDSDKGSFCKVYICMPWVHTLRRNVQNTLLCYRPAVRRLPTATSLRLEARSNFNTARLRNNFFFDPFVYSLFSSPNNLLERTTQQRDPR